MHDSAEQILTKKTNGKVSQRFGGIDEQVDHRSPGATVYQACLTASALRRNDPTLLAKSDPAPPASGGPPLLRDKNDHAHVQTSVPRE